MPTAAPAAVGTLPASVPTTAPARRGPGWGGVVAAALVAGLVASGGTVAGMTLLDDDGATATASATPGVVQQGTTQPVSSTTSTADWQAVSQAVGNSVVAITVATSSGTAVGSGVIYDAQGHIITNHHVVSGATQLQVTLADGRIYKAEVTGTDAATDLAVIELVNPPADLTVATIGDSDTLVTGQGVMAIGNPLGLSSTVTTGIVSALNRPVVTTQEEDRSDPSLPLLIFGPSPGPPTRALASFHLVSSLLPKDRTAHICSHGPSL